MKKRLILILMPLFLLSCDPADIQKVLDGMSEVALTDADIAAGLKEALNLGVDKAVTTLAAENGYYLSPYKILLPEEARVVTERLKIIPGFSNGEEELVKRLNEGAEDAASKAKPIFVGAIKQLTFSDVMNILMGEQNAATQYLHRTTNQALYNEFNPVIVNSLNKFNALEYWASAVNKYNSIPFIDKVNPDLADYVTNEALVGLFALVEKKEAGIRTNIDERTSTLLNRVFAKQDKG